MMSLETARAVLAIVREDVLEQALAAYMQTTRHDGLLDAIRASMQKDYGATPERAEMLLEAFLAVARSRAH